MSDSPRLTFHNRANVRVIDPINAISATPLGEAIQALKALLPVEIITEIWQRDWQAEGFGSVEAYGIGGGLTPKKIRTLLAYAGGSERLQKLVSSWLPSLSVGFAVAIGDNDTLMQFRAAAKLPQAVTDFFDRWGASMTMSGIAHVNITGDLGSIKSTESWLGGFTTPRGGFGYSSIDQRLTHKEAA